MEVVRAASPRVSVPKVGVAALLLVIGIAGCELPQPSLVGRWVLDSGGVVASYWFYDDLTMHRESTVLGFTTSHAGY